jgi:hypothetical protein
MLPMLKKYIGICKRLKLMVKIEVRESDKNFACQFFLFLPENHLFTRWLVSWALKLTDAVRIKNSPNTK